jgi:hypothetical protein
MKRLNRIKNILALILLAGVLIPFISLGKDHEITRIAAAFSIIAWLVVMFWINHLKKKIE